MLRIYADRVTYDMQEDDSRSYQRVISPQDFDYLKNYLAQNRVNDMKAFLGCNSGCEAEELLMLGKAGGRRVFAFMDEQPEFFKGLAEFFERLGAKPGQLRYAAAEKLTGFQVLFADPRLTAGTVWADGEDVRFFAVDIAARKSVEEQVREETQRYYSTFSESEDEPDYEYASKIAEKRRYEGLGWYKFSPQGIGPNAAAANGSRSHSAKDRPCDRSIR